MIINLIIIKFDLSYRLLTATANFTAYAENLFNDEAQRELAAFVDKMHRKGAKIIVSNSDPKNAKADDNFFDTIYAAHTIKHVKGFHFSVLFFLRFHKPRGGANLTKPIVVRIALCNSSA